MNYLFSGAIARIGGAQKRANGVASAKYSNLCKAQICRVQKLPYMVFAHYPLFSVIDIAIIAFSYRACIVFGIRYIKMARTLLYSNVHAITDRL